MTTNITYSPHVIVCIIYISFIVYLSVKSSNFRSYQYNQYIDCGLHDNCFCSKIIRDYSGFNKCIEYRNNTLSFCDDIMYNCANNILTNVYLIILFIWSFTFPLSFIYIPKIKDIGGSYKIDF
jgi:hypothetical protein